MIEFKQVSKHFNDKYVLKDQAFTIQDGEFLVLVGASGSGKTTTLKMINRLIEPDEGDIYLDGKCLKDYELRELRLSIGYVLQQIALFPNLSVAENIALIPEMKKWSKKDTETRTKELLELVGLPAAQYLHRMPSELSGGEQQRIGILRAIIARPKVLLLDEPFSALDPISREQLQDLVKEIQKEFEMTMIFVTHDMAEAMKLGDRIAIMDQGKILQLDTPERIQEAPATQFVADFFQV
ncbi:MULTISPECIES: ABC transporter ATP-binding protein [unclassified Streptococcus]|uniref:ABC transporter ATP-binding protein n=1 Tax=unclassified Streptococcus TaxID=2608887 RepID=UPI001072BF7A|nr:MULTISPECIES: ABC transporter ATP-binding protein [unclassified Streptococcus]MBF0787226.1 ABC transporter ATP-binding protein [Streptococcus sp. 19428wC2_LYSM12]MCQ9211912.1 ABC transporter ATP-binding protein [Streptococcus sp. B01]MCQ9212889.1 ABC transporter ATP-binding protein [Streptococcus sp. O1]MCQ9213241.1 ABC transporter ATP-binding protein [Streptococcus sp. O1]TFV05855.1 ABC transporter ATP-binding protein [Streptococcus sp. LYSM12]